MNRRWIAPPLLAIACTAQTPAISKSEAALRKRAEEFFELQVQNKFRQSEALVADESKDDYYVSHKPQIEGFKISRVEMLDGGKRARVITLTKAKVTLAGAPTQVFEIPAMSSWKLIDGKWYWYLDRELMRQTPFGTAKEGDKSGALPGFNMPGSAPSLQDLQTAVQISRNVIELVPGGESQTVIVTNNLPGVTVLKLAPRAAPIQGLVIEPMELTVPGKSKGEIHLTALAGAAFAPDQIIWDVAPLSQTFVITVRRVEK